MLGYVCHNNIPSMGSYNDAKEYGEVVVNVLVLGCCSLADSMIWQ